MNIKIIIMKKEKQRVDDKLLNKLIKKVNVFLDDNGINWGNAYSIDFKKEFQYPISSRTLHNLVNKKGIHINNIEKLLIYHNIRYKKHFGLLKNTK